MRAFVAYSRPRGILGRSIFTIMVYYMYATESAQISVTRGKTTYSCSHCGKWATITTSSTLAASAHRQSGTLEIFRYDNVEPGDCAYIFMRDSELLLYQRTILTVTQGKPTTASDLFPVRLNASLKIPKKILYEGIVVDWTKNVDNKSKMQRGIRV